MKLLSVCDVNNYFLHRIIKTANIFRLRHKVGMIENDKIEDDRLPLRGKVIGTLFFEPSTRTRWSFESAVYKLGGSVVSSGLSSNSSQAKGESFEDTIITCSQYCDGLIIRTSNTLSEMQNFYSPNKVYVNAGDGSNEHPTQAILDVFTIWQRFNRLDDLKIGIVGDLPHSRTIHSLMRLLGRNQSNSFTLFNPIGKELPREFASRSPIHHCETENEFKNQVRNLDIVYLNRMQKERWDEETKSNYSDVRFVFDKDYMSCLNEKAIVMNPGPRLDEMPILNDDRILYYKQAFNGLFVRMSILCHLFKKCKDDPK